MTTQTLELNGKRYVVVAEDEFRRLLADGPAQDDGPMPAMPKKLASGNFPALEALRVSLARQVITARRAAGWTQAELARRSRVRVETLNRIEKAKVTPDEATIKKIDKALASAGQSL